MKGESNMPLLEHLRELRNRLFISVGSIVVGTAICFFVATDLLDILTAPMRMVLGLMNPDSKIDQAYLQVVEPLSAILNVIPMNGEMTGELVITNSPLEGIYTYLMVTVVGGLMLALPIVAFQIWQFVAPGLYKTEKTVVFPLTFSSTMMFLAGALFAYLVIFPIAFPFFLSVIDVEAMLSIDGYLKAVVRMMVAFGVCFQLPVATWFLAKLGLIDHIDMLKGFRYAVVVIFILAAIITPPDILTQVLLGVPLVVLYAVGIAVARVSTTKVRAE